MLVPVEVVMSRPTGARVCRSNAAREHVAAKAMLTIWLALMPAVEVASRRAAHMLFQMSVVDCSLDTYGKSFDVLGMGMGHGYGMLSGRGVG